MARRNSSILLRVTGNADDARAALRDVRSDLRRMSRDEARLRLTVSTDRVQRQIEAVRQELQSLSQKEASPRVEVQTARAQERLALLELRLDRLRLKRVNIDVDVRRGALERVAGGIGSLERGVQGVSRGFAGIFQQIPIIGGLLTGALSGAFSLATSLGNLLAGAVTRGITALAGSFSQLGSLAGPIGGVAGSVVSLGASLAGVAALGGAVVIALNAVLGAVVALGGALVALVASLGAAIAGFGALAVAFGGVLLPVIAVGVGLFQRFHAILQAKQAREQAMAQATQEAKTAEQQRTAALEQSRQAHTRLAETVVEARRAMAKAAEDQSDAERGLESARLGVREARLNLAEARQSLREFLRDAGAGANQLSALVKRFSNVDFNPSDAAGVFSATTGKKTDPLELQRRILGIQRAQLNVKDAIDQVGDSQRQLNEANRVNLDYQRRGIRAYAPYRRALEQVRRADTRLARSQEQVSAASRKYQRALAQLTGTERGVLDRVNALAEGFKALAKAFTDPIFRAANDVFDSLRGKTGFLKDALVVLGEAFGDVIRTFGAFLRERATQNAFTVMAHGAASLARSLGAGAFLSFLRIMRNLGQAALPSLLSLARSIAGVFRRWAASTSNVSAFRHSVIIPLIRHFREWLRLARAVSGLVLAIFRAAAPAGRSLATSMRRIVERWTAWINANPEKVRAFFRNMVIRARQIVAAIRNVVKWLKDHLPGAADKAKEKFKEVSKVVKDIYNSVKLTVDLMKFDLKDAVKDIEALRGPQAFGPGDPLGGAGRRKGESFAEAFFKRLIGRQAGGIVPGIGSGDIVPAMLEPGEYVLRRAVVRQLGLGTLQGLNAGHLPVALAGGGGGGVHIDRLDMHVETTGTGNPDGRHFGAQFAREMKKRGKRG